VLGLNGWQSFKQKHFADRPEAWEGLRQLGQAVDAGVATQAQFVTALAEATGENEDVIRRQFENTWANEELLRYIARELKPHYKIGLLSNTSQDVFSSIFTPEQIRLFDEVIGSFAVGMTKPDPRMYQLMCERLAVSPDQCVVVDDKKGHLNSAESLGMHGVLYESAQQAITDIRDLL
jgi:putative hydrolase of the HAD superfamily